MSLTPVAGAELMRRLRGPLLERGFELLSVDGEAAVDGAHGGTVAGAAGNGATHPANKATEAAAQEAGTAARGPATSSGVLDVSVGCLHAFDVPGHGVLQALVPVQARLRLDAHGGIGALTGGVPSAHDLAAAHTGLLDLAAAGRLQDAANGTMPRRATHAVFTDADGRRVVRRIGYDATPG